MRFWRNTASPALAAGHDRDAADGTLGYEWDEDVDNGFRPAGLIRLSDTTLTVVERAAGLRVHLRAGHGDARADALPARERRAGVRRRHGAVVWGLDSNHDRGSAAPSTAMQQATVNLFADMGVQPLTLQAGLIAASASTDTVEPTSTITRPRTAPASRRTRRSRSPARRPTPAAEWSAASRSRRTAAPPGSGRIGRATWTLLVAAAGRRARVNLLSRAVDDSGNLEIPVAGITRDVGTGPPTARARSGRRLKRPRCRPRTIQPRSRSAHGSVPTRAATSPRSGSTRAPRTPASIVGNLWSDTGALLSTVTFSGETASRLAAGDVLPPPVAITANTTYVVSYHTNSGSMLATTGISRRRACDNGPLHAPRDGGMRRQRRLPYGATAFPNQTFTSENYWVDVVFVTSVGPGHDAAASQQRLQPCERRVRRCDVNTSVTATFSENVDPSTVTSIDVRAPRRRQRAGARHRDVHRWDADGDADARAPLASPTTYTATVQRRSDRRQGHGGKRARRDFTWSFTTAAPPPPPPTRALADRSWSSRARQSVQPLLRGNPARRRAERVRGIDLTQVTVARC